jgi:hypothetical protein
MNNQRPKLYEVHEDDIEDFFRKIGILESVNAGTIFCCSCGKKINVENFGSIVKKNGEYEISCDENTCQSSFGKCAG